MQKSKNGEWIDIVPIKCSTGTLFPLVGTHVTLLQVKKGPYPKRIFRYEKREDPNNSDRDILSKPSNNNYLTPLIRIQLLRHYSLLQ